MPHMRVPGVIEHRDVKELLKSLEKWHQKELRPCTNQYTETLSLLGARSDILSLIL